MSVIIPTQQERVAAWMLECFNAEIAADHVERNDRFIEEALELTQATGYSAERAHALVDYVFSRPIGLPGQEVGGVMTTLAALCNVHGLDITAEADRELDRITRPEMVAKIRAKQAAKPTGSALPIAVPKLKCEPITAEGIREVIEEEGASGAACGWHPCSGCYETEDGHPVGQYPFSSLLGTAIGSGCHECGGLGARWEHYSAKELAEMAKEFDDDRDQATIDDEAVDAFAKSMKRKLARARAKGRGGWNDRLRCKNTDLSDALRVHVEKGDPVDVANFAMMIHQRYELIAPPAPFSGPESKRDHEAWNAGWAAGEASGRHLAKLEPPADAREMPF